MIYFYDVGLERLLTNKKPKTNKLKPRQNHQMFDGKI